MKHKLAKSLAALAAAAALTLGVAVAPAQAATGQHWVTMKCAAGQEAVIKIVTYNHTVTVRGYSTVNSAYVIGMRNFFPHYTGQAQTYPYFGWNWTAVKFSVYSPGMYTYITSCAWL